MAAFINHVLTHPVMILLLGICFFLSMLAFLAMVRKENRPDYRKPRRSFDDQ